MTTPTDRWRWFRVTLTGNAPCFVLVRATNMADAMSAVNQRYSRRGVTEISDAGEAWDVIDLRELPLPDEEPPL